MSRLIYGIIVIDFDDTIFNSNYPDIGEVKEGAKEAINKLYEEGYGIIINTCRSGKFEGMAYDALKSEGIKFDYMNTNFPEMIERFGMDCRKISGDIYIDDKNLLGIPEWPEIYKIVSIKMKEVKDERKKSKAS